MFFVHFFPAPAALPVPIAVWFYGVENIGFDNNILSCSRKCNIIGANFWINAG
jgi:hypothetical protein